MNNEEYDMNYVDNSIENIPIVTTENDVTHLSQEVIDKLDELNALKCQIDEEEKALKAKIKDYLEKTGTKSLAYKNYQISLVQPKDIETFDKDSFIANESIDVINKFAIVEFNNVLDETKLQTQYPEVYKDCCKEETHFEVDTKKLKKYLEPTFNKYNKVEPSNKPTTIRIVVNH